MDIINNSNNNLNEQDRIAIVGMAGRFPGANNVDTFWKNLQDGIESISFFSDEELLSTGIEPAVLSDHNYVKAGTFLGDVGLFDASFFGFTPREAEITDPQHRLFIECVWEALEAAGYSSETYTGQIGLFAGTTISTYLFSNLYHHPDLLKLADTFQVSIGNDKDHLPTQISYKLNLTGPSINVQTTCSTSLVAVHLACQSLLNGESDITLAGGVSVNVPQKTGYQYQEGGIHSPDGHCRAFDAQAQGTIFGNGLGVVVLKRLEDAIADGDCIHAVIKASAINNDGSSKVGYTAPSVDGQREVILEALALAGVEPETISYIETHGTGTQLGDPIEIAALSQAFATSTNKKGFCAIGSVKTNVGHLNTASGVTSLIKTVEALKHKQIPASLHFKQPNPQIDFANSPFYVNTTLSEWKSNGTPRRAGVSSFGIGGTNAHIILEEAPVIEPSHASRPWQLLLLSAKTSTALETATLQLCAHLQEHPNITLPDVVHTLQVGRRAFEHRRMVVCRDLDDTVNLLTSLEPQRVFSHYHKPSHRPVIFMFSGQGTQYVNMGWELYEVEPTFRRYVDTCVQILQSHLGLDIRNLLFPKEQEIAAATQKLQQTDFTQVALFVIEYALAQLWMEWGVHPEAMIGHSIGEYVAATIAGVFSLEDALSVVATRGKLMQQLHTGSMLAIPLPEKDVQSLIEKDGISVEIATINSPSSCVVSGSRDAIATLHNQLSYQEIECRLLHTSHAFHSLMMEPILKPFIEAVKKVKLKPPCIPFISNVTGTWITDEQATNPSYWGQHLRQTVRFSDGISQLLKQFEGIFLEVGPGRTLSTLTTQHLDKNAKQMVLNSLRHVKEQQSDVSFLLQTLGRLWLFGVEINWSGFYTHERRHRLPLPTYPFERQRYWLDAKYHSHFLTGQPTTLDKKQDIANWFYIPSWKRSLLSHSSFPTPIKATQEQWLFFVDELGVAAKLVNVLKNQGKNVYLVKVGEYFRKLSEDIYTINPQKPDDYNLLFQEFIALGKVPQNIAYLWSLNNFDNQPGNCLEVKSLLFLTQSLGKLKISDDHRLQLWVVSNNIQEVSGNEILDPKKATILSLCKVIPHEYPQITCRSIDVALTNRQVLYSYRETSYRQHLKEGRDYCSHVVDQIIDEFTALSSDFVVAYRDRYRWVQTFEPVCLESAVAEKAKFRKGGVYLFANGLEGIGVVLAEDLARNLQAKLIFIEDSTFPEKDEYFRWLETHPQDNKVSHKIQKLLSFDKFAEKVSVVRADTTNYEQMHQSLATENIGQIHGVIYSSGITSKNVFLSISEMNHTELEKLLESQYHQLTVLENILQDKKLDFVIVSSSLSSIFEGFRLALYSTVNQLIDIFTRRHNQTSFLSWYTIKWDNLQLNLNQEEKTSGAQLAITESESIEVVKRILSLGEGTQVVVSTIDINARSDRGFNLNSQLNSKSPIQIDSSSHYSRPNLSNSYIAPTNELQKQITKIWQEVLGITQVGIYDNFYELGGDSLIATQLVSRLRTKFTVDLPLRDFLLQAMIPGKQAEMIEQLMLEKIDELSEEEVAILLNNL